MYSAIIDASITNIPSIFNTSAGSFVLSDIRAGSRVMIINVTRTPIAFCVGDYNGPPSSVITDNRNQGFVMDNAATSCDEIHVSNRADIYIRSLGAPITKDSVYIMSWGHR